MWSYDDGVMCIFQIRLDWIFTCESSYGSILVTTVMVDMNQ